MRANLTLSMPLLAALLAACGAAEADDPLVALEAELVADAGDPAVAAALADPIMTDATLASRANANAVRPPPMPYAAPIPQSDVARRGSTADAIARDRLESAPAATGDGCAECEAARDATTLAELARPVAGRCSDAIQYSHGWTTRLPDTVPLIVNARVTEAAGVANAQCDVRIVRFWSDLPPDRLIDWYFTRAKAVGYATDRQADAGGQRLAGRHSGGARHTLFVDPRSDGGSDVSLIMRLR